MRVVCVTAALAAAALLAGCPAVDLKELQFTRTKPTETELVGTWRPTDNTLKEIRGRGRYPVETHEIILRADHTFSIRNMPDWWSDGFGYSHGQFESCEGTWGLGASKGPWQIWMIWVRFGPGTRSINLYRQRPPYLIFIRIGDPNNGEAMLFERGPET